MLLLASSTFSFLLAISPVTVTSGFHVRAPLSDKALPYARSLKFKSTPDDGATSPLVDVDVLDTVGAPIDPTEDEKHAALTPPKDVENTAQASWHAKSRKKWGVDNEHPNEYWFDSRIHTLGNTGFWGAVHAAIAPFSTKMIDSLAYEGIDVRENVSKELYKHVQTSGARVLDLCCGVGISTRALHAAFHDAESIVGIDTSPEMISMAQIVSKHVHFIRILLSAIAKQFKLARTVYNEVASKCEAAFIQGNAERTELPTGSFDLVTIMYAFHEAPKEGRKRILREVHRILKHGGTLAVIDISTDYTPSKTMLAGEPYVLEYLENIQKQIHDIAGFTNVVYESIIPGHVGMWRLTCSKQKMPFVTA